MGDEGSAKLMSLEEAAEVATGIKDLVGEAIFGQEELLTETLCCFLSGGHILMTGAPGLAKTTLVRVFASHLGLSFGRIQFTPDLLPSDIIGSEVLNIDQESGKRHFEFSPGPVFTNLLLADEINRASPRTQSALLEAMQERTITVGGKCHNIDLPFMVFATQNPFESEGTFPLPEAQLDRFLVHTLVKYPDEASEARILKEHASDQLVGENQLRSAGAEALSHERVSALMARVKTVAVDEAIQKGISELVRSSRPEDDLCPEGIKPHIWYGAGPRAGISLISVCRALALLNKQESVRWSHVKRMAKPVMRHRIRLTAQGVRDGQTEDDVIDLLLERLESRHSNLTKGIS